MSAGAGEVHQPRLALVDEAAALLEGLEVLAPDQERGGDRPGAGADHLLRLRRLAGDDGGDAALEDAGLLAGNGGEGVAELVLVIERDGRDDAERRARDDVGGVELAAETDLQDQRVGWMLGEGQEGGSGRDLEIGDVVAGVGGPGAREHVDELGLADGARLAVGTAELDALVEADEMRRGVDVHALARGLEHGLEEGGRRALAVGAGDVDDGRQALLRVAELVEQPRDAAERKVDQLGMQRPQLGQQSVTREHGAR